MAVGATTDADKSVVVGRVELLEEEGLHVAGELKEAYAAEQAQGRTTVLVGWGGAARGVIAVADVVKPTSAEAVPRPAMAGPAPGAAHW